MDHGKMEALAKNYGEDLASRFERFFRTYYSREIHKLVQGYPAERSLWVDFRVLDRYDISLADELISNPDSTIAAAKKALRGIDLPVGVPSIRVNVRFNNLPAIHKVMIKDLRSEHVGKFMTVEGIVRKATDVRPKLVLGAYECQKCGGVTRISQDDNKVKKPFICEECESRGPFKLLVSESTFLDSQKILIQESLEDLHGGEHPKQLSIQLEDDLTGKISPGDRVEIAGILRAQHKSAKNKSSRVFDIFLEANSLKPTQLDFEEVKITPEDEKRIRELSKDPRIYEKIRNSIAPHIYGYAEIKEAIMYQLFSSPVLELPDGGRIRGDSHIIIMGEPATGKCVTGDTVLYLAEGGRKTVKDLVDPIFEDNPACQTKDGRSYVQLREPLFVPAMNGSLKLENRRITHVWRRNYKGKIFKITTLGGRSIKTTPEHPFFAIRDSVVACIPAEELVPGELIATPVVTAPLNTSPEKLLDKPVLCDGGMPHLENVKFLERFASSDIFWDAVAGIDVEQIDDYVYDLTVEGCHNFIANGIVVHNSEILQYVAKVLAPRGVYASGKGTSAAGLTAAAIKDEFGDGGWSLEAGALVLADNGVACLMPESKVVVNDEIRRIKELFDEGHKTKAVSRGEEVEICDQHLRTVSMSGLKTLPSVSSRIRRKRYEGRVLEITFDSGFRVRLTPEHRLLHGDTLEWREAREFREGDFVVAPLKLPGRKEDVFLLDILPEDWKAVLNRGDREELRRRVLEKCSLAEFSRRYGVSKDFLWGGGPIKVGVLRQILRDFGCYEEWRERILGYGRKKGGERLKVSKITPDLAYFLGVLFGDGSVSVSWRRSMVLLAQTRGNKLIGAVKQAFRGFSNRGLRVSRRGGGKLVLYAGSNLVAYLYEYITGDSLRNILKLPDEALKAFIAGCLDSDGCISVRRTRDCEVVNLKFRLSGEEESNRAFILALRRFDCYARVVKGKGGKAKAALVTGSEDVGSLLDSIKDYSLRVKDLPSGKRMPLSFSDRLPTKKVAEVCREISSSVDKTVLLEKALWSTIKGYENETCLPARDQLLEIDEKLSSLLRPEIRAKIHVLTSRDYHLDRIVSVKKLDYAGYVYDLYVPGYHNFLCDGILVHNCIDEFDKMEADDRGAMHEAMEQQSYHHDVEIRLADGRKVRIGDLVEGLMREHGDKVIHTENGAKLFTEPLGLRINTFSFKENYPAAIFSVSKHRAPDKFVRLFFDNGRRITVTPEHPIFVFKNGRIETEEADKILEGDHSVAPLEVAYHSDSDILPVPELKGGIDVKLPREMSLSLARVLGLLATGGCIEINRGRPWGVMFANKDEELIRTFNSDIKAVFGLEPCVYRRGDVLYSRVISKDAYRFFKGLDDRTVETGKNKALPELVFGTRMEYKRELLRAVFGGGGRAKEDEPRVELSAESRVLLEQVQELLLEFGIYSYIRDFDTSSKLFIAGNEDIRRFFRKIGFIRERKNLLLREVLKRPGHHRTVRDILPGTGLPLRHILRKLRVSQKDVFGYTFGEESGASRGNAPEIIGALKTRVEEIKDVISRIDGVEDFRDLRRLRTRLGVPQHEIAESLGVVHQTISNWELCKTPGRVEDYRAALRGIARKMINPVEERIEAFEEAVSPSIRFVKVVRKEILENRDQRWVYDIQVEPTHNFISQGLVLHNSVSIAKAGILATFRSRCSILAAANPKFGRFDDYRSISEQVNLPPTILSRFDLIFFVRDSLEETQEVAKHILNTVVSPENTVPEIDPDLLRKYIAYARQRVTPRLTEEAKERIERFYVEMREMARSAEDVPIPLTARQLWAIVRIARAAARVRLSEETTLEDVERAIRLIKTSLKQAGLDLETGRVDIDKIMVGVTKSQRDRITRILEIIREIEKEYGSAKKSEIIDRAAEVGIPEVEAEKAIEKLRKDGHIYDPRRDDRYKVV